jgi:hypothetical protein
MAQYVLQHRTSLVRSVSVSRHKQVDVTCVLVSGESREFGAL